MSQRQSARDEIAVLIERKRGERSELTARLRTLDAEIEALEQAWYTGDALAAIKAAATTLRT